MTQTQLSEFVGASRQTISVIKSGKNIPSLVCAMNIAKALNAPIAEVFFWSDKPHKKFIELASSSKLEALYIKHTKPFCLLFWVFAGAENSMRFFTAPAVAKTQMLDTIFHVDRIKTCHEIL